MPPYRPRSLRRTARLVGALLVVTATTGVLAAPAGAVTRHAAPGGSGAEPCPLAAPCSLADALQAPATVGGDEVVLAAGDYPVSTTITTAFGGATLVRGPAPGAGTARVVLTGAGGIYVGFPGTALRDLTVVGTDLSGNALQVQVPNVTLERVRVRVSGSSDVAGLISTGALIRDSLFWSQNHRALVFRASAGETGPVDLVNVTAIGGRIGLGANASFMLLGSALNLRLVNTLLDHRLPAVGNAALSAHGEVGRTVTVTATHSTIPTTFLTGTATTYAPGVGVLTTPPVLLNTATGDLRQAAGSSTIDAGTLTPTAGLGPTDTDGRPRILGASVDIGAHEFGEIPVPVVDPPVDPPVDPGPLPGGPPTGAPGGQTTAPSVDRVRPRLSRLRLKRRTLSVRVSEAATVRMRIQRCTTKRVAAKKHGGKARRKQVCRTRATVTTQATKARTVKRSLPKKVGRGRYRVVATATDRAQNTAKGVTRTVRVTRAYRAKR